MSEQDIHIKLKKILNDYFQVEDSNFNLNTSLEELQPDFKILSYLLFLEQLLSKKFNTKIELLENISSELHTPKDIIDIIRNQLYLVDHNKEIL